MGIQNVSEVQNRSSYGKVGSFFISFAPDDSKINRWFMINILSTRENDVSTIFFKLMTK
jgi:hypothetical protein